jgi:iron complex transport system ATP-binding protein
MIEGVVVTSDDEAVIVTAEAPLQALSSASIAGGLRPVRSIVNLHVAGDFAHETLEARVNTLARRRGLPPVWIGLATAACTARAAIASATSRGITAQAVVTVGLSNPVSAGISAMALAPVPASTINTIVLVDAAVEIPALVNAVITTTEVKTSILAAAGIRCPDGAPATGTSTDAIVVAATGHGLPCRFGGPISDLGWVLARAVRSATEAGVRLWLDGDQ